MNDNFAGVIFAIARTSGASIGLLGTGFAVGQSKIATAAHIAGQDERGLVVLVPHIKRMGEYQDTTDLQVRYISASIAEYDPIHDISILHVPNLDVRFSYALDSTDSCPPGTRIVSAGYPHANWGRKVLTQQSSTVGARILMGAGPIKTKHIVMNVQTRPGASGSPVFLENASRLCAMVIGSYVPNGGGGILLGDIDPTTLHQTTHAVSAEYIRAMI